MRAGSTNVLGLGTVTVTNAATLDLNGQVLNVRASTNVSLPIANWTILETGNLSTPAFLYTDPTATNYPSRFYRTSTP